MNDRILNTWEMVDVRAVVQIAILATGIFFILQFLGRSRGAGMVRAFGLLIVGIFMAAQVLVTIFDLTVVGRVLDYLLATMMLALLVIFQPELRRGLMWLGRHGLWKGLTKVETNYLESLSSAAIALSDQQLGALIAIEREIPLGIFAETGTRLDAEISLPLLKSLFHKNSPLHDGAVIISGGRILAAGCQLPLAPLEVSSRIAHGMRHRSAMGTSEESDALLIVVSEETGKISIAQGGKLESVSRELLLIRLQELVSKGEKNPMGGAAHAA